VSRLLAGLCTTQTPAGVLARLPSGRRPDSREQALYRTPHLPQGAPTSPALANLLTWRIDSRLHGLARAAGANYTRYADDLAFSGGDDFAGGLHRFGKAVETILQEEGFRLNAAKTRIMRRGERQRVTGIVVNEHCNVGRAEFDTLKATLFNCARTGPAAENRAGVPDYRSHLDGRVSWVEQINPPRGAKLRRLFERIDWTAAARHTG
jgi:RNA-directed DNA polymerase